MVSPRTAPAGTGRPAVADTVDQLIGNTPLLRIPAKGLAPGARILAKLESQNPFASVKDRAAAWMLRAAEAEGRLSARTVIEATSGNTGIALAALCAAKDYHCIIVLPDNATKERIALLRALGAEVVLTAHQLKFRGAIDRAEQLHAEIPGSWFARQHENADNVRAHRETTGPEIWADTAGQIDDLVCGVGTGATLCGTAAFLKERNPRVRAVAVEPASSPVLSRGWAGTHAIPGLTGGFVADTTDRSLIDEILTVTDEEALETARWLARSTGVLAGISSGAALHAAIAVASRPASEGRTIVTILPDSGERYLSIWQLAEDEAQS